MPSISIIWGATLDARTCPICKDLNGYTWTFESGKDVMDDNLVHPKHGVVWNKGIGSRAHGHEKYNCRCHLNFKIEMADIRSKVQELLDKVRDTAEASK